MLDSASWTMNITVSGPAGGYVELVGLMATRIQNFQGVSVVNVNTGAETGFMNAGGVSDEGFEAVYFYMRSTTFIRANVGDNLTIMGGAAGTYVKITDLGSNVYPQ